MKKLFIYYSLTGNGDVVAEEFKKKGYEIRKVISKSKYPNSLFLLMMTGGFKALINKQDELVDFNDDISSYDKIVIASPVWNDRISAPINSVLSRLDLKDKNVDFIFYSASGYANKASEKIKSLYGKEAIVLKAPKKHEEELEKIEDM